MTIANGCHWTLEGDGPWGEPLGSAGLVIFSEKAVLSMSLGGWDAIPDDTMIGIWLADNDWSDGAPIPIDLMSPTRRMLQDMIDGPMVGSGVGR